MDDLTYLREIFELYDCEDHEVIDAALERIIEQEVASEEQYILREGREIHRITLTNSVPASVTKAEINTLLDHDVYLSRFNHLDCSDYHSPGSWFIREGFTVRSTKEDGAWVQYAFKYSGPNNLVRSEVMTYLDVAGLEYDPDNIDEFGPTIILRS